MLLFYGHRKQDKNTGGQTTNCRTAAGTRLCLKLKHQCFDGRANIAKGDWTDFEYACETKGLSKLKKKIKKKFDSSIDNGTQY